MIRYPSRQPFFESEEAMSLMLIAGLVSLLVWVLITFVFPLGVGAVHIPLGLGVSLLVWWWALRKPAATT